MTILWVKQSFKEVLLAASALGGAFIGAAVPSVVMAEGFVPLMQNVAPLSAGAVIEDIRIEGAQRLDRATILSSIRIEKGDVATPDAISRSIKTLFATGLFADLHMAIEGGALIIEVVENPVVNSIKFEGTDTINQEDLEKEIQLKPRYVYTLPQVQQDVQRILELYRRSGRFAATCEPHIETLEQNRVDVTFKIDEGQFTGVRRIEFVGNKNFSDSVLRSQINTSESAWWKFFSGSDYYDPDRVNYDKELLRRFYLQRGYVDFRVISAAAEMTPDKRDFFLTFSVDEGERYRFGKIKIESDIKDLDTVSLRPELLTLEGAFYDSSEVEKSVTKLTEILGDKQYAFIDILPDVEKHKDELVVDLTYRIKSGKRVYIGRIDIAGNTRTLDKVVRREIPVVEGDPYSISKIKRGEQKIRDLGYFESVKVTPVPGSQPDRSDIKVEVKEKSTGEISIGAGFSSTDGPLGDFSIRERNFMGKGQDVRFGATMSGSTKQLDISFTEPYFLDRDLSAGIDVFHVRRDQQDESSYDAIKTGFSFRLGYPLSSYLRQSLSYTLRQDEISDVSDDASRFIRDQEGKNAVSFVSQELNYDRRDSKLMPTKGYQVKFKTDLAGLGGNSKFYRVTLSGSQYYELAEKVILSGTAEAGIVDGFGEDVRINDRFFLGGDTLRGFAYGGIGPRDLTGGSDDSLGGTRFVRASAELSFPTFMPENLGFMGHAFVDAATLSRSDETPLSTELFEDDDHVRASVGLGISWSSPFGPVRLDYAVPFLKESYDETEEIHFSFGTRF